MVTEVKASTVKQENGCKVLKVKESTNFCLGCSKALDN